MDQVAGKQPKEDRRNMKNARNQLPQTKINEVTTFLRQDNGQNRRVGIYEAYLAWARANELSQLLEDDFFYALSRVPHRDVVQGGN